MPSLQKSGQCLPLRMHVCCRHRRGACPRDGTWRLTHERNPIARNRAIGTSVKKRDLHQQIVCCSRVRNQPPDFPHPHVSLSPMVAKYPKVSNLSINRGQRHSHAWPRKKGQSTGNANIHRRLTNVNTIPAPSPPSRRQRQSHRFGLGTSHPLSLLGAARRRGTYMRRGLSREFALGVWWDDQNHRSARHEGGSTCPRCRQARIAHACRPSV